MEPHNLSTQLGGIRLYKVPSKYTADGVLHLHGIFLDGVTVSVELFQVDWWGGGGAWAEQPLCSLVWFTFLVLVAFFPNQLCV